MTGDLVRAANAREQVFLATKISARSGAPAQAQWAHSLADLHVDKIDLLQVHNLIDWQANLRWLRELKEQGRIRYLGITHYREDAHEALERIVRSERIDFVQVNYSVAERNAERTLLPLCEARGVAVLVNRPFQDGRLFRVVKDRPVPPWAGDIDCGSWGQLFLKFIVSHPAVTAAIPATSSRAIWPTTSAPRWAACRIPASASASPRCCAEPYRSWTIPRATRLPAAWPGCGAASASAPARPAPWWPVSCSSFACSPAISCCARCARPWALPAA